MTKIKIMSEILNDNVYGNVIITLECHLNNDQRILNIDNLLFSIIVKIDTK